MSLNKPPVLEDSATTAPAGKDELLRDASTDSQQSTPDPEPEASPLDHNPQQPKRKGGRKPIYATSEERKQRNRQAQAAFRERRTEYIKQLESTIKQHEEALQTLQANHRNAADECLMLRYKNSLLERILLEKGIDVQAELHAKGGSPQLGVARTATTPTPTPISNQARFNSFPRAAAHSARRSIGAIPTKVDGTPVLQNRSPLQPTPASQASSPTTSTCSPNFLPPQSVSSVSPSFAGVAGAASQSLRPQPATPLRQQVKPPQSPGCASGNFANPGTVPNGPPAAPHQFYPSPFQNHIEQLEQEYDAEATMADDADADGDADTADAPANPSPYPHNYFPASQMQAMAPPPAVAAQGANQNFSPPTPASSSLQPSPVPPQQQGPPQPPPQGQPQPPVIPAQSRTGLGGPNHLFDPYDPILDADPFGLSASMHFPTPFSYDTR